MRRIVRDLPIMENFDGNAWEYQPVWYKNTHQLCHTVIAQTDMTFVLGRENFRIKTGERFILDNSFKYPTELMNKFLSEAGWTSTGSINSGQKRMVAHMVKS